MLGTRQYRHAVVCFALQSMLFAVETGVAAVQHPSLYRLPLAAIWQSFEGRGTPCVYAIASLSCNSEYIGSTSNVRGRLYAHAPHIFAADRPGEQRVHAYVRRFKPEFAFIPLARHGGTLLKEHLIRTFCPALNVHKLPFGRPCAVAPAAAPQQRRTTAKERQHSSPRPAPRTPSRTLPCFPHPPHFFLVPSPYTPCWPYPLPLPFPPSRTAPPRILFHARANTSGFCPHTIPHSKRTRLNNQA